MAYGQSQFTNDLKALGINVSRETLQRLESYAALLVKWQAKINLVGPATLPDLWRRHFLDSAQLIPLLPEPLPPLWGKVGMGGDAAREGASHGSDTKRAFRRGPPHPAPPPGSSTRGSASLAKPPQPSPARGEFKEGGGGTLVDLGSGAGFPGLVLAIMTDWQVHLVDSDQRKCAFLRQVALDCGVLDRVTIHARRIEQVSGITADIVTARACAPLDELLGLAAPFLGEAGKCIFLKGAQAEEELTQALRRWTMRLDRRASISDPAGNILIVSQLKRKTQ
jgi:16S rRNA (guanine527-N7)-methyltransferase